eukprot:EG_transcript_30071
MQPAPLSPWPPVSVGVPRLDSITSLRTELSPTPILYTPAGSVAPTLERVGGMANLLLADAALRSLLPRMDSTETVAYRTLPAPQAPPTFDLRTTLDAADLPRGSQFATVPAGPPGALYRPLSPAASPAASVSNQSHQTAGVPPDSTLALPDTQLNALGARLTSMDTLYRTDPATFDPSTTLSTMSSSDGSPSLEHTEIQ